jgi:hypothetical protein
MRHEVIRNLGPAIPVALLTSGMQPRSASLPLVHTPRASKAVAALRPAARGAAVGAAAVAATADAHQRSAPAAEEESAVVVCHPARAATFWTADGLMSDTKSLRIVLPERRPAKARDCRPGPSPFCTVPGLRQGEDQAQECGDAGGEAIRGRDAVFTGLTRIVAAVDTSSALAVVPPSGPVLPAFSRAKNRHGVGRLNRNGNGSRQRGLENRRCVGRLHRKRGASRQRGFENRRCVGRFWRNGNGS